MKDVYRNLIKIFLIQFIKIDREITKFTKVLEKNNVMFQFHITTQKEIIPIDEIIKFLKIKKGIEKDRVVDMLYEISDNSKEIEKDVVKFMNDYKI